MYLFFQQLPPPNNYIISNPIFTEHRKHQVSQSLDLTNVIQALISTHKYNEHCQYRKIKETGKLIFPLFKQSYIFEDTVGLYRNYATAHAKQPRQRPRMRPRMLSST